MFKLEVGGEAIAIPKGGSFGWTMSYGIKPNIETLITTKRTIEAIQARADLQFANTEGTAGNERPGRLNRASEIKSSPSGPISILMEDTGADGKSDTGRRVEIQGLYAVVGNRPGLDYNSRALTLADRRILFPFTFIERSYNIRRKTGDYRLINGTMSPIQKGIKTADFAYRRSTLTDLGEPWTAREVLEDVLTELVGDLGFAFDGDTGWLETDIEGLELHDRGDAALARVLAFIPGAQIYAAPSGLIKIANIYDQSEIEAFRNAGAPNAGSSSLVDRSYLRPQGYNILSDKEVELRFDLEENASSLRSIVRGREPMDIENVIINPLFELTLADGTIATQGEAIQLDDFIAAANLIPRADPAFVDLKLSRGILRGHWLGLWDTLYTGFVQKANGALDERRARLVGALRNDYRRLFRITAPWMDKIKALASRRTAVFDFETGTNAPAPVYSSFITKFTTLGIAPFTSGRMATNTPFTGGDVKGINVAPFEITIENGDIGLMRISPTLDQTGLAEDYVVGATEEGKLPTSSSGDGLIFWGDIKLDADFFLSIIVTAIPDSPNGKGRLHKEFVSAGELATRLKLPSGSAPRNAGPVMDLEQSAEPARFGWLDEHKEAIRDGFYEGKAFPKATHGNRHAMRELALSVAAADYASKLDRIEGRSSHPMQAIEPTGNLRVVQHVVTVGASNELAAFTILAAPGEVEAAPLWSGMPEGLRRQIRGRIKL